MTRQPASIRYMLYVVTAMLLAAFAVLMFTPHPHRWEVWLVIIAAGVYLMLITIILTKCFKTKKGPH
jgi:cell division protein FtsW (lipid II flippase)